MAEIDDLRRELAEARKRIRRLEGVEEIARAVRAAFDDCGTPIRLSEGMAAAFARDGKTPDQAREVAREYCERLEGHIAERSSVAIEKALLQEQAKGPHYVARGRRNGVTRYFGGTS